MYDNDGFGGGGFDVSGYGNGDTPQADKKAFKRTENLISVTIRQVLQGSVGNRVGLMDVESQVVKIVGIVKKIIRTSIKVTYLLEDNTGSIEGVHWLEADSDENYVVPVVENTYATMIGLIRNTSAQHNERHIMVFQIFPITDLNVVTQHALEVIFVSLKSEELSQQTQPLPTTKQEMSSTYGSMDTSTGASDYAAGFNLNPQQQRVLKAVSQYGQSENGASITEVMNALTVKMPLKEIEQILEFLASEGHVYSTSDDKHFKATDSN